MAFLSILALPLFIDAFFPEGWSIAYDMLPGRLGRIKGMLVFSNLLGILALTGTFALIPLWRSGLYGPGWKGAISRWHFTLIVLALWLLIPALNLGNLLGWQVP